MNLDIIKSQQLTQFSSLLANPVFVNALKSANKSAGSDKDSALLKNLEKLSSLLASSEQSASTSLATSSMSDTDKSLMANRLQGEALRQISDELIARADLLEAMLDLGMIPPDELVLEFFGKLRKIIAQLDKDVRELHKEVDKKRDIEQIKLLPSSDTKSGFQEGLKILAK